MKIVLLIMWLIALVTVSIEIWLSPEMDDNGFYIETEEVSRKSSKNNLESKTNSSASTSNSKANARTRSESNSRK